MPTSPTLRDLQDAAWANKVRMGFNTTDVSLEFNLLTEEVGEAIGAWRKHPEQLPGELADLAIYLFSLARMTGVDLEQAIVEKIAVIGARTYEPHPVTGQLVKVGA